MSRLLNDDESHQEEIFSTLDRLIEAKCTRSQTHPTRLPVLEICSEHSAAGKTQLLYYIVAKAVLAEAHELADLDGKNEAVVFIDTDARFDIPRLVQIMTTYIKSRLPAEVIDAEIQELIDRGLHHVHVFQPGSMKVLLETLDGLKGYFFDTTAHSSSQRALHSIIIDSASAFYWETRAALENERVAALDTKIPGASVSDMPPPSLNPYAVLVNRLRVLQQTFRCTVIASSTAFSYKHATKDGRSIRTLPAPWTGFPTARILVRREEVRRFAVGISWEEAEQDRELRQAAVDQGRFAATAISGGEGFRFTITEDGVRVSD